MTIEYDGLIATAPASVHAESVTLDTATLPPTLITPQGAAVVGGELKVAFTLPEEAAQGTVELMIARAGGATSTLSLPVTAAGKHTITLDSADLAFGGSLLSGPEALTDGEYTLGISYRDALLNPAASSSAAFVVALASSAAAGEEATGKGSAGDPSTGSSNTSGNGGPAARTTAGPGRLTVHWKSAGPPAAHRRSLTATFVPVSGARSYSLLIKNGSKRATGKCRLAGSGRHRLVTCLATVPSKGTWTATATASGAGGILASATTSARFRS